MPLDFSPLPASPGYVPPTPTPASASCPSGHDSPVARAPAVRMPTPGRIQVGRLVRS